MIRVSEREQKASLAQAEMRVEIHKLAHKYELTDIEMMQALAEYQQGVLKYMLRFERHGDYETPAGLETRE